jgi:signal transduction histidine kinase
MRYELTSNDGKKIASTLIANDQLLLPNISAESQILRNGKIRAGCITNSNGRIYAFSNDSDYIKSSQKFKNTAKCILESIKYIDEIAAEQREINNKNTTRLIHNLTSLNAHNIQEIYSLIPQEEISGRMDDHIEYAKKIIERSPYEASKVFLKIAKNNAAMKTEFSVFKKLFNARPELRPSIHTVHKVLMNVLYLFFPDFTDKTVEVIVNKSEASAFFDYESMHVALYHMIDNAAKYTKPNSKLNISITAEIHTMTIVFRMCSIKILKIEQDKIFDEGFSGSIPLRIGKSGHGVGMSLVKRIIESNHGTIIACALDGTEEQHFGIEYQVNEFTMHLPSKKPLQNSNQMLTNG